MSALHIGRVPSPLGEGQDEGTGALRRLAFKRVNTLTPTLFPLAGRGGFSTQIFTFHRNQKSNPWSN